LLLRQIDDTYTNLFVDDNYIIKTGGNEEEIERESLVRIRRLVQADPSPSTPGVANKSSHDTYLGTIGSNDRHRRTTDIPSTHAANV
jgi:hypothetical protein